MLWVHSRHSCAELTLALVLVLAGPTPTPAYTVLSRIDHPCDLAASRSTPAGTVWGATGNLSCVHGVGLAGNSSALSILSGNLSLPPLAVDPLQQTLLTVQLWGGEHLQAGAGGAGSGSVTVSSADGRPGHGNASWKPACPGVIGCLVESSPRLLGRWVYMSIVLPPGWTVGRHQVQLVLTVVGGSASPLLFSIVTHVGAAVQPTAPQGTAPPLPPPRPPTSALTPHVILRKAVDEGVTLAKAFQLWGTAWDAQVATGAAPAIMTGAFARGTPSSYNGSAASLQEWKDKVICSTLGSNNNYLRLAELFARAYTTVDLPDHYQNPELLLRVTSALDFYTVAQGSNGGYDDRNHGKCWVGAPHRAAADGVLEGYGHTGFASAFLTLHKEFEAQGVLEQTFDDDDNSTTPNVTRRDGWARLLNMSRVHMTSQKYRGHASNQDCSDQMAGWEDNQGLKALNANLSWIDSKEWPYVLQCLGVAPGPDGIGSWWISPMGISQEPGGARGGGYSHAYGETPGRQMVKLALEMGHEQTVGRRLMDWLRAFAHFRYLDAADIDTNSSGSAARGAQQQYRTVWSVSSITWRHEHLNGDYGKYGIMAANGYGALHLRDSWAHRMCELWLAHNGELKKHVASLNASFRNMNLYSTHES